MERDFVEMDKNLNVYVKCAFVYIGTKREGQRKKEVEDKFEKCNNVERIDVKQFIREYHKVGK